MSVCPHPRTRREGKQSPRPAWIPASAGMTEWDQQFVVMPVKTGIQGWWVCISPIFIDLIVPLQGPTRLQRCTSYTLSIESSLGGP